MGAVLAAETVAPSTTAPVSSFEVSNFTRSLCLESEWNCSAPATVFARDALLLTTDADASLRYDTPFASTRSITVVASFETTDASAQQFVSLLRDEANGGIVVEIGPGSRVRLDGNSAAECKNMSDEGSTYSYDYEGSTYDLYVQNSDEGSTYSYDNEGSTTYDTYLRNSTYSYDYEGSTTYDTYLRNSTYSYDYEGSTTYDSYLRNSSYSYDYESSTNGSYLRKSYEGLSYSYDYEGSTYDLYARIDQDEMVVNLKSSSSDCALYSTKGLATVFEGDDAFLSFGGAHTSWISLAASDEPPTSAPTSINPSRCVVVAVAMDESGSMFGEQAWLPGELSAIFANVEARNFTSFNVLCVSGFGGTESPRDLGCSWFTSSTDYDATFEPFVLDGFLEDGYQGLELAVNISATFIAEHRETFDAACTSVVRAAILVTDEDRDVIDAALTYDAIADLLREDDWILNVIVSIAVSDSTIGVNRHGGTIEATGNGTYAETPAGTVDNRTVSSYAGNTKADYVDLAWDNAGIAWNLEVLREGGASAESFSSAFVDVKVEEITSQTFSPTEAPVLATLSPTPLPTKATTSPKPTPAPTETTYVPTIPRAYPPTPLNLPPTPKPSPLPTPVPTVFVDSTPRPSPQATATGTPTLKPSPLPTPVPTVFVDSTPRPSPQATAPGIDTPHPSTPNPTTGQPTTSQPSTPPTNGLTSAPSPRSSPDPSLPLHTTPKPTILPSNLLNQSPTRALVPEPSLSPIPRPTNPPTHQPVHQPTTCPTRDPTLALTLPPLQSPTPGPVAPAPDTNVPTPKPLPSPKPSVSPVHDPTLSPTPEPTPAPVPEPTPAPQHKPTLSPQPDPTRAPIPDPTRAPIYDPTRAPVPDPTRAPVLPDPTRAPVLPDPTRAPVPDPTRAPVPDPTRAPVPDPTRAPVPDPTRAPVPDPTRAPVTDPTLSPVPGPPSPQRSPTTQPTALEATAFPTTDAPAATPTVDPSGALPSSSTSTESAAPAASSFRVAITTGIVLDSLDAGAFNADETARSSFRESMADVLEDFETTSEDISNILASPRSSRRRLDESSSSSSNSSDVSFAANVTTTSLDAVVEDVKAVLLTAATDGTFDDLVANLNAASDAITDSTEFNEDLSLRLIDELTGIVGGTSPTPSCAAPDSPSLVSVQFVSTGSSVVATFDQDTDQGGLASGKLFECTVLFDAIPTGLACSWISPSQVEAETGDSEINIGSNWTLRANVIASSCDDDCACSALAERQTVAVAGPDAAIVPVVVFQAPSTVSICADLGVDAYLSSGSTSHDWVRVDWTISSSEASSQQQQQQLLLEDLARNATGSLVLAISTEQLSALYEADARSLTFSLELVNYFDETGVGSIDVQLSPDPRPTVKIVGGTAARDVFRPDLLSVNAYATPASCVASDVVNLEYAWTLTFKGGESTGLESTSNDPREFRLPAHSLQALATYTLEVMVTDLETGNFSTTSVDLECLQSDLVASIDGGNRSISQRGVEEISAELSRDPDVFGESSFELLSYAWTCANLDFAGDQSCERAIVGNTTNASILLVDKEVLGFTSFLFAVRVSRPGRTAQTDSVVIEHTIDPPSVFVTTRTSTPPANNRLVITGVALAYRLLDEQLVTRRRLNTTWSLSSGAFADDQSLADVSRTDLAYSLIENTFDGCEDNDATWYKRGDPSRDCEWVFDYSAARCDARGEDGRFASEGCPVSCSNGCQFTRSDVFLLVNPDSLIEGSSYTFRLEATLTGASDVGVATVDLSVPRSPRGGDVETSPSRGITLETAFTIRATKWEGNEPPLRYRFEVAGGQVLRLSTEDSVAEDVILPVGAACAGGTAAVVDCNVTLVVAITDNIGASTDAGIVAQVNPTFLNSTRLLVVVQNLLEQAKAASAYENVCNVAIAAALSSPDDSQLLELLVSSIAEARELSQGTAEQTELFAACLEAVVTDSSALARETAGTALTEILGVTRAASSILFSSDAAQNSLTVVSQLLDSSLFTSTSSEEDDFVYTAASASANVSLTIDSFTNALIAPLVPDEFATTTYTPNLRVSTRKNSGRDAIDLEAAPGSNARATVPAQPQQYGAAVSEVSVNTHRLEEDGGELSSTSVLRFGLTTSSLTVSGRNTTASLRFPTSNATSAPTAMPLRENVTIACPWNFRGVAQAYCEAENRTISRQCNGTKVEETIGCGVASRDACVTWDGQSWAVETCVRNPDASTEASTVCDCTVDFAYVSNFDDDAEEDDALEDDDDEISETTSEDYATKGVFQTYGQLFARNVFGGSINPRRSRIMIIVLCVFYAVISVLMYASDRFDRRDLELKATTTAARPPGGGTPSSPDTPPDGSSAALDDAVFVVVEDDSPQYETGRRLSRSKSERVRVATALAQTRATVAETYLDPERPSWRKRFLAAMAQHHPFASIWTAYNPRKPRYARVMVLGLEMLLIGASYTFEKQFEFPDPNCREKQSRERCLDRTTFTGRNMCKWNENRGECKYNPPPEDSYRRPEHFFVLLVTTLVVFLMLVVLEESFDVVAKTDAFRIYLTRSAAQASSSGGAPPDVQQHPRASAEQRASFYKGRVSRTSFGFRGRPSRGESMVVVHGDRKVRYGAPPPASSSYGRHTLRRLPLVRKPKHIREEARERTPDVAIAVAARYEEIRTDVREASALQNVVGARRVQILYEIERDFVRKWGYSTDVKVLKANVYRVVLEALELARQWDDIIERIHDPDQVRRLVTEFARVASLSPVERKVYERTVREGFFDGDSNDDEDEDEHRENRKNRPVVTACALLLFSGFLFLPSLYLCVYATNVGRGETINWLVSTAFLVAILYALAIPLQIFLVRVVLPSLILDKLHHNPRLNAASYPFATPLPLDALDFLLDLRPELGPIVDDSEDRFVAELKRMKDHKEDIPLHILEEISTDMRWQRVAIVAAGLFLAGGLLALPQVVQDTIFGEIAMLAPLGAFYFLLNITGSKDDWNSAVLALVTLVLSAAFVVALSNLVAWLHNAILSARGARLRNRRVVTSSLESSVDNSAAAAAAAASSERDSSKHLVASSASESASATDPGDDDAAAAVNFDDSASDPGDDLVADHRSGDDA